MANFLSVNAGNGVSGVSIDDTRRIFNFGERVAELAPQQSPFFVYLSKVAKKPTDDPVFKFLEQRHQWQRRNFQVSAVNEGAQLDTTGLDVSQSVFTQVDVEVMYDKYGKPTAAANAYVPFIIDKQVIAIEVDYKADGGSYSGAATHRAYCIASATTTSLTDTKVTLTPYRIVSLAGAEYTAINDDTFKILVGAKAQIVGSAFEEGTNAPLGWEDKLYDREGYCQIFKTGMNLFSGTAMATRYRGHSNEYQRIWRDKLMEHKMDIEHSMLFGVGKSASGESSNLGALRYSWGVLPYTEQYGKIYSLTYATSGYDAFLDAMEDFFAPESGNSGNKLVLASRKVITYLNKMGSGGFLNNTVGSSQYRLDVQNIKGSFGHQVTVVNTIYGNLHFVAEPLLRGMWEDYCVAVDMSNLAYRPLAGNGKSRDTFVETNIQDPGIDGRKDQIITEAGLEISLPETHAILKFS